MSKASVKIAGLSGKVEVTLKPGATVVDVLTEAAETLGVEVTIMEKLSLVVNGASAVLSDPVPDDAVLTAAPKVQNG